MPAPSPLAIATGSVKRLLKEETSYHKELADQEEKIKVLQEQIKSGQDDEEGNAKWILKQQQTAADQTRAVFVPLRQRINEAAGKLEDQIAAGEEAGLTAEELETPKSLLAQARATT